ncbi:MAG TPA: UPF0280 family protein [Spirochaetota bacterium]|nr:UPF0280 family protein [Spirochaetota bacterium]HPC42094.1 UPF0280 family protein [Spirochaetota bacterium]HPL18815.1 UPF0280 family protein [Spirochaetota bacterium]HQF09048.1 UPF0280 family protein [Spirochaetota bacterium]HQH97936.1 UPF0280 family protein [Spirochaetota bacterium]
MKSAGRTYRDFTETERWQSFRVKVETSDLFIRAGSDLSAQAERLVRRAREEILRHIDRQNGFLTSYTPVERLDGCPEIVTMMYDASERAGVGPMAAVAGAVAEAVGRELMGYSEEIIIENGGDIWMRITSPASVLIYPGGMYFNAVALKVHPDRTPCGICTSSARIGHSFSFGKADAATIIAPDAALADAIATEACNRVQGAETMEYAADYGMSCGAAGVVILYRDRLAARGEVELADPEGESS